MDQILGEFPHVLFMSRTSSSPVLIQNLTSAMFAKFSRFPSVLDLQGLIGFIIYPWCYTASGAFLEKICQFYPLKLFLVLIGSTLQVPGQPLAPFPRVSPSNPRNHKENSCCSTPSQLSSVLSSTSSAKFALVFPCFPFRRGIQTSTFSTLQRSFPGGFFFSKVFFPSGWFQDLCGWIETSSLLSSQ